jgi:hypothetical protein
LPRLTLADWVIPAAVGVADAADAGAVVRAERLVVILTLASRHAGRPAAVVARIARLPGAAVAVGSALGAPAEDAERSARMTIAVTLALDATETLDARRRTGVAALLAGARTRASARRRKQGEGSEEDGDADPLLC